jgi:shikimate dehydrogenase
VKAGKIIPSFTILYPIMKKYGLIGYPISHSFSKKYFTEKFEKENIQDHVYELFSLQNISDLPQLLRANPDLCGLNVTIPHKIGVMFYLDWIDPDAKKVDAVNCIRISEESAIAAAFSGEVGISGHEFKLEGFNTDIYGFEYSLKPLLQAHHKKAIVLGNGGAARAVKFVLKKLGIDFIIATRRGGPGEVLLSSLTKAHFSERSLIINCTSAGNWPNVEDYPDIPYEYITSKHLLYDLIYNPEVTAFLRKGLDHGATIKNGYEMLELQAERSWEIWNSSAGTML